MNFKLCSVNYLLRCLQRFYFIFFFSSFKKFVLLCLSSVSGRDMLRESLPKTGPLCFGSENRFPLNFAHEYILVQK